MDHYLTARSRKTPWWEYLIIVASGVLMMGFISTGVRAFDPENPLMSILATLTLTALAASPLAWMLVRRDRRSTARLLAEALWKQGETVIPFHRMDDITGVRDAAWKLYNLFNKGYMRNVAIDQRNKRVTLLER